jgi:hypothetical protein
MQIPHTFSGVLAHRWHRSVVPAWARIAIGASVPHCPHRR